MEHHSQLFIVQFRWIVDHRNTIIAKNNGEEKARNIDKIGFIDILKKMPFENQFSGNLCSTEGVISNVNLPCFVWLFSSPCTITLNLIVEYALNPFFTHHFIKNVIGSPDVSHLKSGSPHPAEEILKKGWNEPVSLLAMLNGFGPL